MHVVLKLVSFLYFYFSQFEKKKVYFWVLLQIYIIHKNSAYWTIDSTMIYQIIGCVVIAPILGYLANRLYFSGGRCKSKNRLDDKVAIITGGNTGIGYYTALDFARRGAHVILACRDLNKADNAAAEIKKISGNQSVEVQYLDLADLETVRQFSERVHKTHKKVDLLINNAGIMMCPNWRTKQGFEMQFGTNHLGLKENLYTWIFNFYKHKLTIW